MPALLHAICVGEKFVTNKTNATLPYPGFDPLTPHSERKHAVHQATTLPLHSKQNFYDLITILNCLYHSLYQQISQRKLQLFLHGLTIVG